MERFVDIPFFTLLFILSSFALVVSALLSGFSSIIYSILRSKEFAFTIENLFSTKNTDKNFLLQSVVQKNRPLPEHVAEDFVKLGLFITNETISTFKKAIQVDDLKHSAKFGVFLCSVFLSLRFLSIETVLYFRDE